MNSQVNTLLHLLNKGFTQNLKGGVMKNNLATKLFFVVILASFIVPCVPNGVSAQKVISLNYANFFPAPHKHSILAEQWCKEIEQEPMAE